MTETVVIAIVGAIIGGASTAATIAWNVGGKLATLTEALRSQTLAVQGLTSAVNRLDDKLDDHATRIAVLEERGAA